MNFHTKIKIAEKLVAQSVPLHATGPIPPALQHVNFDAAAKTGSNSTEGAPQKRTPQTFLQRYVSLKSCYLVIISTDLLIDFMHT